MTRKEKMDLLLAKVPESDREAFIADLRQIKSREDIPEILEKYHIDLTEEDKKMLRDTSSPEISDEDLDLAAGGCEGDWSCSCHCSCDL